MMNMLYVSGYGYDYGYGIVPVSSAERMDNQFSEKKQNAKKQSNQKPAQKAGNKSCLSSHPHSSFEAFA